MYAGILNQKLMVKDPKRKKDKKQNIRDLRNREKKMSQNFEDVVELTSLLSCPASQSDVSILPAAVT